MASSGANTYRVGDFVYFEDPSSTDSPYQIRRIDELNRTQNGVEARAILYVRRRDIPVNLLKIADQAQRKFDNYYEVDKKKPPNFNSRGFIVASEEPKKDEEDTEEKQEKVASDTNESEKTEEVDPKEEPKDDEESKESEEKPSESGTSQTTEDKVEEKKEIKNDDDGSIDWGDGGLPLGAEKLTPEERLKLRQHEIFLTRQSEVLPVQQIRGKCRVTLLGEVEHCESYLSAEDTFYYSLVYDPVNMTLLADKGAIRVGEKFQADVNDFKENVEPNQDMENASETKDTIEKMEQGEDDEDDDDNSALQIDESDEKPTPIESDDVAGSTNANDTDKKNSEEIERDVQVYHPYHNLTERDIDQFLIIARAVGTFARAIDSSSSSKIPTLQMAAACASRDVTIFHAMSLLHHADYDVGKAVKYLVPPANKQHYPLEIDSTTGHQTQTLGGPLLCRDQMEEWSAPEANLFDEALEKCGKDFNDIKADYLPWKSMRDIIEYYYQYKASNRYTERKKIKQAEAESKLKQVYISSHNKANPHVIGTFNMAQTLTKSSVPCENCKADESQNWYNWGGEANIRLCQQCWTKWKKDGGLEHRHKLDRFDKNRPQKPPTNGSDNKEFGSKTQTAVVNPITKSLSQRQLPNSQAILNVAKQAYAKGQISLAQLNQLQQDLAASNPPAVAKTASKPNIVYYTTICRRVLRRVLPKTAFNQRKLARKPFSSVDHESILKSIVIIDRDTLLSTAKNLAENCKSGKKTVNDSEFQKGIIHLQHSITAQVSADKKRPTSSSTPTLGEPAPKLQKMSGIEKGVRGETHEQQASRNSVTSDKNALQPLLQDFERIMKEKGRLDEGVLKSLQDSNQLKRLLETPNGRSLIENMISKMSKQRSGNS